MVLGLIGYPLGHSFSRSYFTDKFDREGLSGWEYRNFAIDSIDKVKEVISTPELVGFNITIPYKQDIFKFLDEIDPTAAAIGAVNCVKIIRRENQITLKGYNTDYLGFIDALLELIGSERPEALVLGTGGASKAVCFALEELSIGHKLVSRHSSDVAIGYNDLTPELIKSHKLIINATPLGMYPNIDSCPAIDYNAIDSGHYLYDLVYNPAETLFCRMGYRRGAKWATGLGMLISQAERGWEIWTE